jgi:hypothetical protein
MAGAFVRYGLASMVTTLALASAAAGQDAPKAPTDKDYRQVVRTCKADYAKFCDTAPTASASGRDQAICLKYQKQDLSLPCRTAVNAVSR